MKGGQQLAEREPGEQVLVRWEMTGEMRQDTRLGVAESFNPGKLLRQGIRHRPLRLVEEFWELSNGHNAGAPAPVVVLRPGQRGFREHAAQPVPLVTQ